MNTSEILNVNSLAINVKKFNQARWVTDDEGAILYSLATIFRPDNCFECGTANGYSALWLASAMGEEGKVHTFDHIDRPKVWDHTSFKVPETIKDKIIYHNSKFSEGVETVLPSSKGPNLFFIDGDHSQTSLVEDTKVIEPFLKKRDIIIFHDIREISVLKICLKFIIKLESSNSLEEVFKFNTRRGIRVLEIR